MRERDVALGIYQEKATADAVLARLKAQKFSRFATIRKTSDHDIQIKRFFSFPYGRISQDLIKRFKNLVTTGEILIVVEVDYSSIREALNILQSVKSGHPVTFLLRPPLPEDDPVEIPSEPISLEALSEAAVSLSLSIPHTTLDGDGHYLLMKRLQKNSKELQFLKADIANAEYAHQSIPSSAEWLLDNMYIIEGSIEDVKLNLPKRYYKTLPKLVDGPLKGLPRIYALASDLVKYSAGSLNQANIIHFLTSYQRQTPLTIGELWAFPSMLRLRLIEWIKFLAVHIDNHMRESELAGFWGNRLLNAAHHDTKMVPILLERLAKAQVSISSHFASELIDHLFDEESILPLVKTWLENYFKAPLDEVHHEDHLEETTEQVAFSNSIKSLIALLQMSWKDVFETISPVDAILREDPARVYAKMDFTTRNAYREIIEKIAKRSKKSEAAIAAKTITLSKIGNRPYEKHVGYYLIDKGREQLEKETGFKPTLFRSFTRWIIKHSTAVYIGGIALLTLALEGLLFFYVFNKAPSPILILTLLPVSEISVQLMNFMLAFILPTPLRPKMLFEFGIPPEYKTLVVVPILLNSPESVREEISRLEIRYLANSDPFLSYGIFSDFKDAKERHTEKDAALLEIAKDGIKALAKKYGENKFFLFHRERIWSKSENAWIGWERKRGKLEYLNRFLIGEELPENIVYAGNKKALKDTRFVITLDADTELPKDQARALVEVLAHPLNQPYVNAAKNGLVRGYTIIQPRIATEFVQAKSSPFTQIFSEPAATDPYTQAISNVYQDLTGEGAYHGKGIYDVTAFHTLLTNHFPEDHILSHDLIEGAFVRTGFASNICLFDTFPKDYATFIKRQWRWVRGDFQIIDWLFPTVPTHSGKKEANPLSYMNRWKIFDNLRRALLPSSLLLLLITAWTLSLSFGAAPKLLTALVAAVLIVPNLLIFFSKLFNYSYEPANSHLKELGILVLRSLISIALLPIEAYFSVDAALRVFYRKFISRRNLLQWNANSTSFSGHKDFVLKTVSVTLLAALLLYYIPHPLLALPFCVLWMLSPLIIYLMDKPSVQQTDEKISADDKLFLRKIARKTWGFFDEFVGAHTHWLPPDNYQTALNVEFAARTSPTNIGLWLVALMNAHDFKYISCDTLIDKALSTIQELQKMERHEGHFLNWYNTQNLDPLFPRYVSTVDSGNLLACFWMLSQGLGEIISSPILSKELFSGLKDTYALLHETNPSVKLDLEPPIRDNLPDLIKTVKASLAAAEGLSEKLDTHWLKGIKAQLIDWDSIIYRYFRWVQVVNSLSQEELQLLGTESLTWKKEALSWQPTLETLAAKKMPPAFNLLIQASKKAELPSTIKVWGKNLEEALATAEWFAGEKMGAVSELIQGVKRFSEEMNLKFLYNPERKLFSIGYNVDAGRLDASHYDLLASEARLTSFVAIAKQDVPLEHWWTLGRLYSTVRGRRVLLSWGGTMFEYLMPLIFNKQYKDSLIGEGCNQAVLCQIDYGNLRDIPWGISESAYSAIDAHKIYQYKSFGVPGLGLKRGLEDDLVVSPYSTVLALAVNFKAAIKNLKKMAESNHLNMTGLYGYYESMDFTRQKSQGGERGVVVYTYMAHHQGMIFAALNNFLNNETLIGRFHKDPRISGINSLLYERVPSVTPRRVALSRKEPPLRRLEQFSKIPILGVVDKIDSVTPKINLLSNDKYSLMITSTGGGYSRWDDIEIYRWRADTTQDSWGSFCYIQDMKSKNFWSNTFQPTLKAGSDYSVNFKSDKTEFRRSDTKIETLTEIVVSPEDNAEIRLITLINHSRETRYLELTSYLELVLAPHAADRAHPAFNKLFIETESVDNALLGFRRLRSPGDRRVFAVHILTGEETGGGTFQYETDREKFIGRGRTLQHPAALDGDLSNTTGTVLDPCFSLRRYLILHPGQRVEFSFVTAVTDNREAALLLIKKYKEIAASHRAIELAWNYSQLELRYLRVHQEEAQLFQKLASRLIYPHAQFRSINKLRNNRLGQSALWAYGISGDLPIVVVTAGDLYDVDLVKQLLIAHTFWSLRGLKVDLVILNEEETGYTQALQGQLQDQIRSHSYRNQTDQPGGVFLRNSDQIPAEDLNLIFSCAHAVLVSSRGSLRQQLVSPKSKLKLQPPLVVDLKIKEVPSAPLPFLELPYFNGIGGYTADGKSYVIYLGPNTNTPAPWINVIAGPEFGTIVTESGLGCTWFGNSQTNRLNAWSNDPLLNPITDALYIRDEETGFVFTPTPLPIRELDAYRISHSQGYTRFEHNSHGINQELTVFVPPNKALRIQSLKLTNTSARRRKLTVTSYTELVLGSDKENTQMHVITEWDPESKALFAYNRYNPDFGGYTAFFSSTETVESYTGDRAEFLGRNQTTAAPEALKRTSLSGHIGAGLDPCAALQVRIELAPGEEKEVFFVIGYTKNDEAARVLISEFQPKELFEKTVKWWDKTLETIQVETPDLATNFFMNRWLVYQDLSCRFFGRSAFYQSSGAYGFRDQLQDCMTLVYSAPEIARAYILKAAARQFVEGDVQHWWHPQSGAGVRTRCSDDFLWLPFVTAHYVRVTGDKGILKEEVPFLESDILKEGEEELFQVPKVSNESASLLEHCRRAVIRGNTKGPHGLPLIGTCDWNDGMNLVGVGGKGESVWLAWFYIHVLYDFAELVEDGNEFKETAKRLAKTIEAKAWDGEWYIRAFFDDGTPIGSHKNIEARIDSIAQSWSVISGLGDKERSKIALESAEKYLVNTKDNLVLLLTPPFDKTPLNPGYIKGYPPGVRENGGQYTHAATWLALAYARVGNGSKAAAILRMISPTLHTLNAEASALYRVEPYVIVADIYDLKGQIGRGGWSWYTGAAGWVYRVWLEEILGFTLRGDKLSFRPCTPKDWDQFKVTYRHKSATYIITVLNPDQLTQGACQITLDGIPLSSAEISLSDDGLTHTVTLKW